MMHPHRIHFHFHVLNRYLEKVRHDLDLLVGEGAISSQVYSEATSQLRSLHRTTSLAQTNWERYNKRDNQGFVV